MAKKRMVSNQIVDSDDFLDMPLSAQCLYFHLLVRGDDEGFINGVKKIMRMIGARDDDYKVLVAKSFVIPFESGVCVIKHWLFHNTIRKDRIIETVHLDEKLQISVKENNAYTLNDVHMTDTCHPRLVKSSLEEVKLEEVSIVENKPTKETKHKFGEYKNVLLTEKEYNKLKSEHSNMDSIIDWFSAYVKEKAPKSKSHNLTIRRWVISAYNEKNPKKSSYVPNPNFVDERFNNDLQFDEEGNMIE